MSVKLRERPGKGWYVLTDWNGQRKAKFFGKDKALAKALAAKLAAKLKWAEQSGEAVTLATKDGAIPTVTDNLSDCVRVYAEAHCKPSTASGYRIASITSFRHSAHGVFMTPVEPISSDSLPSGSPKGRRSGRFTIS